MFQYDYDRLNALLAGVIRQHVSADSYGWLVSKSEENISGAQFNTAFVIVPRKTGKSIVELPEAMENDIQSVGNGLMVRHWSIDRLARVWLLMQLPTKDKETYFRTIENLFLAAEMQELVALYSALPVLGWPEIWEARCAEGIRSNIGDVLEAVMCNNPYPARYLKEPAWNQLVLKAFFTEKPIEQIIGFDERANQNLADTLSDFAHERWAAGRQVPLLLWRGVGKFLNPTLFEDIRRLAASPNPLEQEAANLACFDSNYPPAKQLLNEKTIADIRSGKITWNILAEKTKDYVLQS